MNFYAVLAAAISDFAEHGYDSETRLQEWMRRLEIALHTSLPSVETQRNQMELALGNAFKRAISDSRMKMAFPGIKKYTIDHIKPSLRSELTRRILLNADLIKINREEAISATLRRFAGWASSVPEGGSRAIKPREEVTKIASDVKKMGYINRRRNTDQGMKLSSAIRSVVATQTGAIAAQWHHVQRTAGYEARPEQVARSGKVFAIRNNWAIEAGLMNKGSGYTDEIEQPAEFVYCSCSYIYINNLRDLPPDMLTEKGRQELERVRKEINAKR